MSDDVIMATADGEVLIRNYTISEIDYRTALYKQNAVPRKKKSKYNTTGQLYVTNRRIVYNVDNRSFPLIGHKTKDLYSQQIRIEDIQGIDFMTSSVKPSLMMPLVLVILGLALILLGVTFVPGIIVAIAGLIWVYLRSKNVERSMVFGIRTVATGYSMYISEMSRGYAEGVRFWCAPTDEFETMAKELGAIVLDLQKNGDSCISRWVDLGI